MPGVGSPIVASCLARPLSAPPFAVSSLDVIAASPIQPCRCPWNASSWTEPARRPKSIVCPGAQFRKDLRHPQKPSSSRWLRRGQRFFRNWTQGDDIAGGYNKPGVPNISGAVNVDGSYGSGSSGAFYRSGTKDSPNGQNRQASMTYMDASRSNSLYGASTTVMPASVNQPLCLYLGRPS